jgi:membrane associated rhomboid family serine protease
MATPPIFNKMPRALGMIAGAIVMAHVARILLPASVQDGLFAQFGVIPARWEAAGSHGDYIAIAQSAFGHVFLHGGWLHLLFNMALFVSVGRPLSQRLAQAPGGDVRFALIFFACAATGALTYVAINRGSDHVAIGASGAVCGIYSAYLMAVYPRWQDSLRDMGIVQNAAIFLAMNVGLAYVAARSGVLPIAWEAHLGGFIGGLVVYPLVAPPARMEPARRAD